LTQSYRLRGYDAVQLATALVTNGLLETQSISSLVIVTADNDLNSAAAAEGLPVENPLNHE
jgi:predicted nucleic acid-binding protein